MSSAKKIVEKYRTGGDPTPKKKLESSTKTDSLALFNYYELQKRLEKEGLGYEEASFKEKLLTGKTLKQTDQSIADQKVLTSAALKILKENPNMRTGLHPSTGYPTGPKSEYEKHGSYDIHHPSIKPKGTWMGLANNNDYSNVKPVEEQIVKRDLPSRKKPVQPIKLQDLTSIQPKRPLLKKGTEKEQTLQPVPVKNVITFPKDARRFTAGDYLESQNRASGYVNYGDNKGRRSN